MRTLKKEGSKKEKKSIEMFEALNKIELHFIRGGSEENKEKDDGNQ